jgi:hypothetical protein
VEEDDIGARPRFEAIADLRPLPGITGPLPGATVYLLRVESENIQDNFMEKHEADEKFFQVAYRGYARRFSDKLFKIRFHQRW